MNNPDTKNIQELHKQLHSHLPSDPALRVKSLESLLVEKGLLDSKTVDEWIETFTERVGPQNGAKAVAKAWINPVFRNELLENGSATLNEMGLLGIESSRIVVVENTPEIHNVVVCTLCSCYPWSILGLPPSWYKSAAYRSRIVRDPRGVLAEFGLILKDDIEVRVWDSTSELRYMVLPERPKDTEGMGLDELADLVTRNSMIGTERAASPQITRRED